MVLLISFPELTITLNKVSGLEPIEINFIWHWLVGIDFITYLPLLSVTVE